MPYKKRPPLVTPVSPTASADRIAAAYVAAKMANPKLTQREFARKAMPTIANRYQEAKTPAERRKIENSGARYLRLVLQGKRSGRVNVEQAARFRPGQSTDLYQVRVTDSKGIVRSFNLVGINTRSQLDLPLVEAKLREDMRPIENRIWAWRERYDIEIELDDIADWEVRRVLTHRRHAERIIL